MKKLKKEIFAALLLFGDWLKKKMLYLFKNIVGMFSFLRLDMKEFAEELKEIIDDFLL